MKTFLVTYGDLGPVPTTFKAPSIFALARWLEDKLAKAKLVGESSEIVDMFTPIKIEQVS